MPSFDDIEADFTFLDDWEDRYKYLIDLGKDLAPLSEAEHRPDHIVKGCASQVWLVFDVISVDEIRFRGDSDAMIVKGLVALVIALFSGKSAAEIGEIDVSSHLERLGLTSHLTPQRSNGLASMVRLIQSRATEAAG